MNTFKSRPFDDRLNDANRILEKYPDRIPVIIQKYDKNAPEIDKYKFLASDDTTVMSLLYHIRKHTKLRPEQAIFLSDGVDMCVTSTLVKELYHTKKDKDNFLYIYYSTENTFG